MKVLFKFRKSHGLALIATICAIAILLIVFAGVMGWISTNGKQTRVNQIFTSSEAAAEGASEMVFAQMDRDYLYGNINQNVSVYEGMTPITTNWPVQYTFNVSVNVGQQSTTLQYLANLYTNLLAYPETNTITATATPVGQFQAVPATVSQTMIFSEVPVFQFAIFYNMDLDMSPGSPMSINGNTFCNENIWCYPGGQMTFNGSVEAAGTYFFHWDTNGDESGNIANPATTPTFNDGTPLSHADPLILPIGGGGSSTSTNSSTSVEAIINIPPSNVAAPQEIAYNITNQIYLFNAVDLIVSNAAFGLNGAAPWTNPFTVYLQDRGLDGTTPTLPRWTQLTNDVYIISNCFPNHAMWATPVNWVPNFQFTNDVRTIKWTNSIATGTNWPGPMGTNCVWYAGFSYLTNVFYYDYRESDTNETVQLDVGKLGTWITNATPNAGSNWNQTLAADTEYGICSIFIYNDTPFNSQMLPSVSVVNGALLPCSTCTTNGVTVVTSGLTVATPQPLYVIGNYNVQTNNAPSPTLASHNVSNTYPASFMADAITMLSSNWPNDWYKNSPGYTARPAANTTVNAACLEGIVPSNGGQKNGGDGSTAQYSGGIENFLRLLENWSGYTCTYNGSIMVMFPSQYATNVWQLPDNYYGIPSRNWAFDTNFLSKAGLPPLTPNFRTVVRNSWAGN
jgi:hypothetical protein